MILALLAIAVLLAAAEWLTRPPTVGRRHAPQHYHRPRRHSHGTRDTRRAVP